MEQPTVTKSLTGGYIVSFNVPFDGEASEKVMVHIEDDGIVNVTFNDDQESNIWVTVKNSTVIINAF